MVPNLLLSRPIHHGIRLQKPFSEVSQRQPNPTLRYRISKRYGTTGFSLTAADISANKKENSMTRKSPRLNPWLLRPSVAPLNPLTIQHLLPPSKIVAMNARGLEYFQFTSVLSAMEDALNAAGANVENDATVTSFFTSYSHAEGCAMCILLAIGYGTFFSRDLRQRALSAALARAYTPKLMPVMQGNDGLVQSSSSSDPLLPQGYVFHSSALLDGVKKVTSRLLRPVWHKAFAVVTEGRTVQLRWKAETRITPAKVELLLDERTLEEIIQPLNALVKLMEDLFQVAVASVPGVMRRQSHMMDIDEDGGQNHYITNALMHQNQLRDGRGIGNGQLPPSEAETIAKLTEERKIHSLYRLVSRTTQLLRLLSLLCRAHNMIGFPEVEWGSLHGLTISQLVQTRVGQERLEKLLNNLVTSTADSSQGPSAPSAQANDLANQLADQCYLFFSPGSRYAYLGFRLGTEALNCQPGSTRRSEVTAQAANHFRRAARHWHSSSLVTGKSLNTKEQEGYEEAAIAAHQSGSPLARAVAMLVELGDVDCVVDICLIASSNFYGTKSRMLSDTDQLSLPNNTYSWEHDLYHKRREPAGENGRGMNGVSPSTPASPSTNALALGTAVTSKDAITTCWALIFYHLSLLLQSRQRRPLAEQMVSRCASENDISFLHAFFRHMHESGNTDTLLRIESVALEDWLQKEMSDPNLLYMYYMKQEKYYNAGKVATERAYDETTDIPISERIEFLSRAISAFSTALKENDASKWTWREHGRTLGFSSQDQSRQFLSAVKENLSEVKDTLDIARLQSRILEAVSSSDPDATEEIKELSTKLIDVTTLFNNYASKRELFSICLLILHSCKSDDTSSIQTLWRNIFQEELFPCSTRKEAVYGLLRTLYSISADDELVVLLDPNAPAEDWSPLFENGGWIKRLEKRIISLGKELYGSGADFTFPVDFIFTELEKLRSVYKDAAPTHAEMQDPTWSTKIVVEVGVPYIEVLNACENFAEHEENELLGAADEHRLEQLSGMVSLLSDWVMASKHTPKAKQELSQAYNSRGLNDRFRKWQRELERQNAVELRENLAAVDSEIQYLMMS